MAVTVIILQQIDANIINPKILGDGLKISPILVIFAVTIGGEFFGVIGMFLSVPVIAILKLLIVDFIEIREKKKAEVQIDTSQFTADSLQGLTASVSNLEAVKGYHPDASLNQITHDTNVIKKLEADISKVDFDTPGTYDITYNVTVYCKALKAYIDQKPRIDIQEASNGQTYKIPLKGKIQVVEKEQALKDSASGRYIYGLQMQMRQE